MRRTLSGVAIAFPVLALCVSPISAPGQAPAAGAPSDNVLASFAVPKHPDILLLPVELKGKKYSFGLFTGVTGTIFDSSLIPFLGNEVGDAEIRSAKEDLGSKAFEPPADAKLGALSLSTGAPVFTVSLQSVREVTGEEIYGIIGMDFFQKYVVHFDPDRGVVSFLRSPGRDAGERFALQFEQRHFYVQAHLSGADGPTPFLVDTGSAGLTSGSLQSELFHLLDRAGKVRDKGTVQGARLGATVTRQIGKIEAISLGGIRGENLFFSESEENSLGLNFWSRYAVTFDFPGKSLYLKKGERSGIPDQPDRSGLKVLRVGGSLVVKIVVKDSPAEAAGVRPEDVIVSVDGKRSDEWKLSELRRYLCGEGKSVRLSVRRDGAQRDVVLALRARPAAAPAGN